MEKDETMAWDMIAVELEGHEVLRGLWVSRKSSTAGSIAFEDKA